MPWRLRSAAEVLPLSPPWSLTYVNLAVPLMAQTPSPEAVTARPGTVTEGLRRA